MAALQYRNETYRVIFRHHGKQHSFTIGKVSGGEAATKCAQVDYLLMRLKQGLLTLPAGVGIVEFLQPGLFIRLVCGEYFRGGKCTGWLGIG